MSAFGGIVFFDRAVKAQASHLAGMRSVLEIDGSDGTASHICGPSAFEFCSFHTTAESLLERQPWTDRRFVVMFDGRIDNRHELSELLGVGQSTDVELFALSFKTWKMECFARLLGDFAVAIWDSVTNDLVLARDPFAVRKLFFICDNQKIVWATSIRALLSYPGVSSELDESFVAMSLSFLPDGTSTPFKSIKPVEPGTLLVIRGGSLTSTNFWSLSSCLARKGISRQPVEELKILLREAVSVNLRSHLPVTAELSGGLDSSTIACLAHLISNEPGSKVASIRTISHVYDRAAQSDERDFISLVEAQLGQQGVHIREDDDPTLARWPDPTFIEYPNRVHCFGGAAAGIHRGMRLQGSRVLLSGLFGDQLFVSSQVLPYAAADMIKRGKIDQAFASCYKWSICKRQPLWQIFWHAAIRPTIPYKMRKLHIHRGKGPCISPLFFKFPAWLSPDFARRTHLLDRVHCFLEGGADLPAGSAAIRFANLKLVVGWFSSGYSQNRLTSGCIETRYPYLYRPLVEFLLSLPYDLHCDEETSRKLQREAVKGVLPEQVRARHDKRGPHEAVLLAAKREYYSLRALIETSSACRRGFTVKAELLNELNRWRNGQSESDLLKFIAVEHWLRALEGQGFS